MAAAEVLDERVPGADYLCTAELFEAEHRPESGLQAAVVGFDGVVGVGLGVVPGARGQLVEDGRVDRCLVGDDDQHLVKAHASPPHNGLALPRTCGEADNLGKAYRHPLAPLGR